MRSDQTGLNPAALVLLVVTIFVTLQSRRQTAVKAVLLTATLIPLGQQLIIFGLHFPFYRIMILVGFVRVIMRRETAEFRWCPVDKLFLAWALSGLVCGVFRGQFIASLAGAYNSLGAYFLMRFLMPDVNDLVGHLHFLAVLVFLIGISMFVEYTTRHNPFFVFGGVPEMPNVRGDRVRCQGPFRSEDVGGAFPATLLPLMIGLWFQDGRNKRMAVVGIIGCLGATILSNASGPLMCVMAGGIGFLLWKFRDRMSLFRRATVVAIIGLSIVMKAPVWFLIAKVSDLIGGGGWHRSFIIDVCIKNFKDWWLIGYAHTITWTEPFMALLVDPDNIDITNHYVVQAVTGGIWMLGLFIATQAACFKVVGRAVDAADAGVLQPLFLWSLGVSLGAHCAGFFSISYFDQIQVFWYWFLAVISCVSIYFDHHERAQPLPARLATNDADDVANMEESAPPLSRMAAG